MRQSVRSGKGFTKDTRGTVAPVFGLFIIPLLATAGLAVDFSGAYRVKSKLQHALDAATAAVCSGGNGAQSSEEIIRSFLNVQLSGSGLSMLPAPDEGQPVAPPAANEIVLTNAEFNPVDGSLAPQLQSKYRSRILEMFGYSTIDVEAATRVACGGKRLELALVLDVTGSMDETISGKRKIDSLKEAGRDVLDIFEASLNLGGTRIALVPFSNAVNAGSYADSVRGTIANGNGQTVGKQEFMFRDANDYNNWLSYDATTCVSERRGAQAYTDAAPDCSGGTCTAPVGHVYTSNGQCAPNNVIVPLSANKTLLEQQIDAYTPVGWTAGQIGTAWGWYVLSNKWASIFPVESQPEAANPEELIKATIIMTDGLFNTQYYRGVKDDESWEKAENGSSQAQFDQLCSAMKNPADPNEAIVVYTIGFGITENSPEGDRLKACASDNSKYFFPYDGDDLRATFVTIGNELSGARTGRPIFLE